MVRHFFKYAYFRLKFYEFCLLVVVVVVVGRAAAFFPSAVSALYRVILRPSSPCVAGLSSEWSTPFVLHPMGLGSDGVRGGGVEPPPPGTAGFWPVGGGGLGLHRHFEARKAPKKPMQTSGVHRTIVATGNRTREPDYSSCESDAFARTAKWPGACLLVMLNKFYYW